MTTAEQVRQAIRALLPTVDLDRETERTIHTKLEKDLGDLSAFDELLEEELNAYLESLEDQEDETQKAPENTHTAAKDEGKRPLPTVVDDERSKRVKIEDDVSKPVITGEKFCLHLSQNRQVNVEKYQGKLMVSIREYYQDHMGEHKPTKKGLTLNEAQWLAFTKGVDAINAAFEEGGKEGFVVNLSATRKATVSEFKGRVLLDLREYYGKGGEELKPTSKGIALPEAQWQILQSNVPEISDALGKARQELKPQVAKPTAETPTVDDSDKPTAIASAGNSSDFGPCYSLELSGTRRATVQEYKGQTLVSVREYYKDKETDELKPGAKGLSMNKDQWQKFVQHADAINTAVKKGGNQGIIAELSSFRKVDVHDFSGKTMVSMREFYVDKKSGGEMKPGKKGITLTAEQWDKLYPNVAALDAAAKLMP